MLTKVKQNKMLWDCLGKWRLLYNFELFLFSYIYNMQKYLKIISQNYDIKVNEKYGIKGTSTSGVVSGQSTSCLRTRRTFVL